MRPFETCCSSTVNWLQLDHLEIASEHQTMSDNSSELLSEQLVVADLSAYVVAAVAERPWPEEKLKQVVGMLRRHD